MSDLQRIQHYLLHFAHLVDKSQLLSLLINRLESHKILNKNSTDTWTLAFRTFERMGQISLWTIYRQRNAQIEQELIATYT